MHQAPMSPVPSHATGRFEALDGWRGVCACLVVLFHFHGFSPIYHSPFIRHSYLFVDFFFVLSGFVIAWNYATRLSTWPDVRRFLVLRIGRVWPLHVVMLALFVAYELAKRFIGTSQSAPLFSGETSPLAIFTNFFLVQSLNLHDSLTWNGPSWSISTEVWTYVVFALLSVGFGLRHWMLALAAIVPPLALLLLSRTGSMDVTYDFGILRCIFGFALGTLCFHVQKRRTAAAHATGWMPTVLEFVTVAAVIAFVSYTGDNAWSMLAPFVFAAAVLVFASEDGLLSRLFRTPFFAWLGKLSYSIYLTHFFVVMLIPVVIKRVAHVDLWTPMRVAGGDFIMAYGRNDLQGTLFYALAVGLTLALSTLTYRWVEEPGRDWSRRFAGKRPAATPSAMPTNSLNGPWSPPTAALTADAELTATPTARRA
ncbi:acyltransferase family protein [Caenimonas aquaedulcis]|uniref:Acyltransferase n=1 Tax=Caenimonas aquaedulcis TaxID=2793270 RepID=A0A931H7H7_9BURK|nr:acyltransferase [Caenimonas aquaedulcis]MBG9390114.1 acyltransferase [Caenimonas aquaedulcis]